MPKLNQAERSELSDRRLINTALRLIVQRGIGGTHLTEVGLQAGYSRGLAAMRFGTKAGLISHVAHHAVSIWVGRVNETVAGKIGIAAVLAAIDAQCAWMIEAPEEVRALYLITFQSFDPGAEFHLKIERFLAAQRRDMSRWLREARDAGEIAPVVEPDQEAEQILASMVGFIYVWLIDPHVDMPRMYAKLKADVSIRLSCPQSRHRLAARASCKGDQG